MKLATTTADFRGYAETPAEQVKLFDGTGFRFLDLNLYRTAASIRNRRSWMIDGRSGLMMPGKRRRH